VALIIHSSFLNLCLKKGTKFNAYQLLRIFLLNLEILSSPAYKPGGDGTEGNIS